MNTLPFLLAIVIGGGALASGVVGWYALQRSRDSHDAHRAMLYLLAINLCEPLVNSILIGGFLAWTYLQEPILLVNTSFALLAPMVVLLTPAAGLFFSDARDRRLSAQLLGLGLLRWGINLMIFSLGFDSRFLLGNPLELMVGLILIGTGVLWFSALWGKQVFNTQFAVPRSDPQPGDVQTRVPRDPDGAADVVQS